MKIRHNKKRNTAFVYEALIREVTVAILKGDHEKKDKVISVIRKHFRNDSLLKRDLECYRSLYENQNLNQETSKKILKEARIQKRMLDPDGLFKQQTELIHDINKELSPKLYNNFVPNYKTLATIDQIFSLKTSPKNRIILESEIINNMVEREENSAMPSIDNITYREFVKKFNKRYDSELLNEQKELLTYYIASFSDNALSLKVFLNEEIARLKTKLTDATGLSGEIKNDEEMIGKTNKIIKELDSYAKEGITENILITVLRTQTLVEEIYNGDND
jgi:hypothetical protein